MKKKNMKNITVIITCFILISTNLFAQDKEELFYYYNGEKIFLQENTGKIFIKLHNESDKNNFVNSLKNESSYKLDKDLGDVITLTADKNISDEDKLKYLKYYQTNSHVLNASFMITSSENKSIGISNQFIVKLKPNISFDEFQELLNEYQCVITKTINRNQVLISIPEKSSVNALNFSNLFFETGLFEFSEPNFYFFDIMTSIDPFFGNQWPLINNGQNSGLSGADINIEDAWDITEGSSDIKIAVIDGGVDLTHPDLIENLLPGFDPNDNNGIGGIGGNGASAHGTACAGIIAAVKDNGIGIAGVAPNCKIIPIKSAIGASSSSSSLSEAFTWAWQNGADVISNSYLVHLSSSSLDNAINDAVKYGRDGLGCVVLFATGNGFANSVSYPASLPYVIAVGASSNTDEREAYSNFGNTLDVVAPGGNNNIYTTDIQGVSGYNSTTNNNITNDYTNTFSGTSAACPYAAGVVALMLSVNKCLNWQSAKTFLELTCNKVGGYTYGLSQNQIGGTWNVEMGHGRINASKAVQYSLYNKQVIKSESVSADGYTVTSVPADHNNDSKSATSSTHTQYRVFSSISFPHTSSPRIEVVSNGISSAFPNSSNTPASWSEVVNITNTSAVLRTYVYSEPLLFGSPSQTVTWTPESTQDVRFDYSVISTPIAQKGLAPTYCNEIVYDDDDIDYKSSDSTKSNSLIKNNNVSIESNKVILDETTQLKVYPNPNNGQFNIFIDKDNLTASIKVYDVMGKVIFTKSNAETNSLIDITKQPQGIYLIKVTINDKVFTKKIIYQ